MEFLKHFILFMAFVGLSISTYYQSMAQDFNTINPNGIYLETYLIRHDFSEGFVSINYERSVGHKRKTNIRVGIYPDFESTVSFPVTISWITNPTIPHHFEYGIGAVYRVEHFVDPSTPNPPRTLFHDVPAAMIPLMYRYQKQSGFYLRAGVNVLISYPVLPSPSVSAGYRF